ncbi:ABC transporter permease [Streptomyces sp. 900105755]
MKPLRLLASVFSLSLRRDLAHRVNFAFDLMQSLLGLATVLATTMAVFHQTRSLAGWSRPEALVLVGVYSLVSGLRGTFVDPNLVTFVGIIRDGTLDEALLRPAPSWFTTTCREHTPLALGQSVLGLGIIGLALGMLPSAVRPLDLLAAAVLACCAVAITWALSLIVACAGFWAGRFELAPLTGAMWDIGRYPAGVYRQPLRTLVTYVIPFAGMITLPATALTRASSLTALLSGLALAVGFAALAVVVFRQGIKRYTGATS